MCLEVVELDLAKQLNTYLRKAFDLYANVYRGLTQDTDPLSSWTTKVQRTNAGGGRVTGGWWWRCAEPPGNEYYRRVSGGFFSRVVQVSP